MNAVAGSQHAQPISRTGCRQAAQQDLDEHQAIEDEIRKFEARFGGVAERGSGKPQA